MNSEIFFYLTTFRPGGVSGEGPVIEVEGTYVPDVPLRDRPVRPALGIDPSGPGSSSLIGGGPPDRLPPGIEPDVGTFINIDPTPAVPPTAAASNSPSSSFTRRVSFTTRYGNYQFHTNIVFF